MHSVRMWICGQIQSETISQRETISIEATLEKVLMSENLKLILKVRTEMVERIYKYFDLDFSESHRPKLYICTLLEPRAK
jgi:hypothetical protein